MEQQQGEQPQKVEKIVQTPPESQRSLALMLVGDLNTFVTGVATTVGAAYGVKKIIGTDSGQKPDPPSSDPGE